MYQVLQAFKLDVHCTLTFIMCKIYDIKLLGDGGKILGGCWAKLLGGCIPPTPRPGFAAQQGCNKSVTRV